MTNQKSVFQLMTYKYFITASVQVFLSNAAVEYFSEAATIVYYLKL